MPKVSGLSRAKLILKRYLVILCTEDMFVITNLTVMVVAVFQCSPVTDHHKHFIHYTTILRYHMLSRERLIYYF